MSTATDPPTVVISATVALKSDNKALRDLFTLPPIRPSAGTALVVPELPPRQTVTGDAEIDAVLWLRQVISSGDPVLIEKAMQARALIKTPLRELGQRYTMYAHQKGGFGAAMATFGFDDLDGHVKDSLEKAKCRHEAEARFGSACAVLEETASDKACAEALASLRPSRSFGEYNEKKAAGCFAKVPALVPHTLDDCMHVLKFASRLWELRRAVDWNAAEGAQQTSAHERYAFGLMTTIPPRDVDEGLMAYSFLREEEREDYAEAPAIIKNLIQGPRPATVSRPSAEGASAKRTKAAPVLGGGGADL